MLAPTAATVASLEVILLGENYVAFGAFVKVFWVQLTERVKARHVIHLCHRSALSIFVWLWLCNNRMQKKLFLFSHRKEIVQNASCSRVIEKN